MKILHPLELTMLHTAVVEAFVARKKRIIDGSPQEMLSFLLVVQERYKRNSAFQPDNPMMLRLSTNQVLDEAIKSLSYNDQVGAEVLRLSYVESATEDHIANKLNWNRHKMRRYRDKATEQLAETIFHQEKNLREKRISEIKAGLEPGSYNNQLIGRERELKILVDRLLATDSGWMVTITGVGGIGKTSLAHMVVETLVPYFHFEKYIWVTIGAPTVYGIALPPDVTYDTLITELFQKLYPHEPIPPTFEVKQQRVRQQLKATPHLIIIDNLEIKADTAYLLMHIGGLTNPTKFLITSRVQPPRQGSSFIYPLKELDQMDAITLLRDHTDIISQQGLSYVEDNDLIPVHELVGGNPHALKMVAELADLQPLVHIMAGLQTGQEGNIDAMYERIYTAVWHTLSDTARSLLQVMPLVSDTGSTPEHLQAISGLDSSRLWPAITELINRSILNVQQFRQEMRYSIHRLTETFLQAHQNNLEGEDRELHEAQLSGSVAANIQYWQQYVGRLQEALPKMLEVLRPNLLRAVQMGLAWPQVQGETGELMYFLFPSIEHTSTWRGWIPLFDQAIRLMDDEHMVLKIKLLICLGQCWRLERKLEEATTYHEKAEAMALEINHQEMLARAQFNLSADWRQRHDYEKATSYGLAALAIFSQLNLQSRITAVLNTLGLIAQEQGDLETAVVRLQEAVTLGREVDEPTNLARSLHSLSETLKHQKRFEEAEQYLNEALTVLASTNSDLDKVKTQLELGSLFYRQEAFDQAEAIFRQVEDIMPMQAIPTYYRAILNHNLGNVLVEQARPNAAEPYLKKSRILWQQLEDSLMLANTLGTWGKMEALQGNLSAAHHTYKEALDLLTQYPHSNWAQKLAQLFEEERNSLKR